LWQAIQFGIVGIRITGLWLFLGAHLVLKPGLLCLPGLFDIVWSGASSIEALQETRNRPTLEATFTLGRIDRSLTIIVNGSQC
jgi:hypothetical protein